MFESLSSFSTLGFNSSFMISLFKRVHAPLTSPLPCLVAKNSTLVGILLIRHQIWLKKGNETQNKNALELLNWPTHPSPHTRCYLGWQPFTSKKFQCNMKQCCTNNWSCEMSLNT
jgi:hypothetical protein